MSARSHLLSRIGVSLLVASLAVLVWSASASGHAAFLDSQPGPGVRVKSSPSEIALDFTEPLNRQLSRARVVEVSTGKRAQARIEASARKLVLRPAMPLGRAAYRVEWHSVSTLDGHALEGSFSFGVRTAAAGGEHSVEQSPLARGGVYRIVARWLMYAALLTFAGALLLRWMLPGGASGSWLVPAGLRRDAQGVDAEAMVERERALVLDVGLFAASLAAVAAALEAADAGSGLSIGSLRDFLLANATGLARVAVVVLVLAAALVADRSPRLAAGVASLAVGAVAVSGHANSASPRFLALVTDWVHLLAGAVWLGGIALIVLIWGPALRRDRVARRAAVRHVLPAFGRVALPAFLVVVVAGVVNAAIELGGPAALWETAYGQILMVKVALVGLIAAASHLHAVRLRPALLAANPHPEERLERSHWRLVFAEPLLALGVVGAVAALVAFPLTPGQLSEAESEERSASEPPCDPCPLPVPAGDQLSVAEQAGSQIVAAWIRRRPDLLTGVVRLLDRQGRPSRQGFTVSDARQSECGAGCRRFTLPATVDPLRVQVIERGRRYVAQLPTRWRRGQNRRARQLLERAQATMRALRSVREVETVSSGPGSFARTVYRLRSPDRFAYRTNGQAQTVVVGKDQWFRTPPSPWMRTEYGGGLPFRTRSWFRWTPYARAVRLLGVRRVGGRRLVELALMDPGTPVWQRLLVDARSMRIPRERMITKGHYMTRIYSGFNERVDIEPPARSGRVG